MPPVLLSAPLLAFVDDATAGAPSPPVLRAPPLLRITIAPDLPAYEAPPPLPLPPALGGGALTPERIPPTPVFDAWDEVNTSVPLGSGGVDSVATWEQPVARGEVKWKTPHNASSIFAVLPGVLKDEETDAILALVRDTELRFDEDPDTVDGMATHEIFVEDRTQELGSSGSLKQRSRWEAPPPGRFEPGGLSARLAAPRAPGSSYRPRSAA